MNNMKPLTILMICILSLSIFAACNKDKISAEVIKDCTGVYLRENGLDRLVCNDYILDSYESGSHITVEYDILDACFGLEEEITCSMIHEFHERLEITEIF